MKKNISKKSILITGCAGFIGFHTCIKFLGKFNLYGIDSLNTYYDINLKKARLDQLKKISKKKQYFFKFKKINVWKKKNLNKFVKENKIEIIIHLAAQPGVRYSIENPRSYIENNIDGFFNILEVSKICKIKHLVYASSSSVYGNQKKLPISELADSDNPLQLYAATKKANEMMANSYSNIYKINITGLRFFTVYGPWGRPDMALFKFTKNIINNQIIHLHNHGNHKRDYTYVGDIANVILKISNKNLKHFSSNIPHSVFNVGNQKMTSLKRLVELLEKKINKKSKIKSIDMQPGEILNTFSDTAKLYKELKLKKFTNLETGVSNFISWYKNFYKC